MAVWFKVKWIDPFFDAFNRRFQNRTKASDGTIGDEEHKKNKSGHNADDTAGSKPEREDVDTKPEVRAADVTSDLHDPNGVKMYDVVQAILAMPADRDRFIYIICDGWIWQAANGWKREVYGGSDKHFGHGHYSGHPDADENGAPFLSILNLGDDDVDKTEPIGNTASGGNKNRTVEQILGDLENDRNIDYGEIKVTDGRFPAANSPRAAALALPSEVKLLRNEVAELKTLIENLVIQPPTQAMLVAALNSPEGQQAIATAVEYAGDH